jgi:hypothetical protein
MVAPTCFGIILPSSGSVPSAFWEMLNWGAVDRILWMGVLCPVTLLVVGAPTFILSWYRWPHCLRHGSSITLFLGYGFESRRSHTSAGVWMSVSCECCVLSGRGLCDGPIPRPEESYRLYVCVSVCVIECDQIKVTLYTYIEEIRKIKKERKKEGRKESCQ